MTAGDALRYAANFGIAGTRATELAGGYSNATWRVARDGGDDVVVRRYGRLHVTRNALFYEHAVMRHAAARTPAIVAPLDDPSGDSIRLEDGAFVGVLPYVSGVTGDRRRVPPAAATLAAFHLAMRDFRAARPRATRTLGTLAWLRERFVRFAADPALARALDWNALIAATAGAAARIAPYARELPVGVVHADPHPDNVVARPDGATALIDFDFTHETERAYDVATAADAFARDAEDGPLDPTRFAAFVVAYERTAPLTPAERAVLWDMALRRSAMLVWYVVTRHGERARGDVGGAARYVARAREIERLARAERIDRAG